MSTRIVQLDCDGDCGDSVQVVVAKYQVLIPVDWVRLAIRNRSEDGASMQQLGHVNVCSSECAYVALRDRWPGEE